MPKYLGDVRCWVNSGKHLLALSFSGFDPGADGETIAFCRLHHEAVCQPSCVSSAGTNPATAVYRACFKNRETGMKKIAKVILAGTATLTIISSAALGQQALTGTITKVDRINGTVAIQQTQSDTTGANIGGAEEFKTQKGLSLDTLHAGDKVTFSATETGGIKTITKIQTQ
jgi:Cu/Ag efflux protein CusF